jgi:hypothetical protein
VTLPLRLWDGPANDKTGFFRKPVFDAKGAKTVRWRSAPSTVCRRRPLTDAARYYDTSYLEAAGIK